MEPTRNSLYEGTSAMACHRLQSITCILYDIANLVMFDIMLRGLYGCTVLKMMTVKKRMYEN